MHNNSVAHLESANRMGKALSTECRFKLMIGNRVTDITP